MKEGIKKGLHNDRPTDPRPEPPKGQGISNINVDLRYNKRILQLAKLGKAAIVGVESNDIPVCLELNDKWDDYDFGDCGTGCGWQDFCKLRKEMQDS